ncbi:MAG: acyltransferase domain-containing protein, partial [Myxococcales bacterium]|nr:acyltransferase domain-containing protein [Myxococcales bacterium]
MSIDTAHRAVAIVGVGAVLPDARDAKVFWKNICDGRYSIRDVPEGRWDPALYYDADHRAEGKTYSKIGGWCTDYSWDPLAWRLPLPPKVSDAMDRTQKWAIIATREALLDCGWPERPIDTDRTAVIFGNALAGDKHYMTSLRIHFPEFADELAHAPSFAALPAGVRAAIVNETMGGLYKRLPPITEDTMPGELSNVIAGRVAQMFNLHGPNYVTDAACASAMAAITAAMEGLEEEHFDVAITGGIDGNMSAPSFVKFCKIGALSGTGTRPYADGADGFVMGEGAAVFVLKRLADAERDGDRVYAVIRGTGGSSDGRGKGITAPNPVGQKLAIERAWHNAGVSPETVTMIEGHGTSTRVGDRVEVESMDAVFGQLDIPRGRIALGSVKSNIGHLKGAAGAAGVLKAALSLHHKQLPPSINFDAPNPAITFDRLPVAVNTELRPWNDKVDGIRRAGVSAFGFGGTNFHAVLEEYVPGRIAAERDGRTSVSVPASGVGGGGVGVGAGGSGSGGGAKAALKAPLRGALVIGGRDNGELAQKLGRVVAEAKAGNAPPATPPRRADLEAPRRIAIDFGDAEELATKGDKALSALQKDHAGMWKALAAQGVFVNQGRPGKVAFLYTGQGSQYANMCGRLREVEPIVARVFDEADRVMTPLLGRSLSSHIFVDPQDEVAKREAELRLMQTEITQPAVLAVDAALHQLLEAYGVAPDMVMGHSLGEYGALVAAGALPFSQALEAVSARGAEMARVSVQDNGAMVAVFGPLGSIQRILGEIDGYVVVANLNSHNQAVVGGATDAVTRATQAFVAAGMRAIPLPVSHAFHTRIVAPASEPLMRVLTRMDVRSPRIPLVANVTGDFYPQGEGVEAEMVEILGQQIASPVQFVKGLETLYDAGVRVFVEVGPKKALAGLAADVLGDREGVLAIHANHPKVGDVASFNQCLCALYAAGLGDGIAEQVSVSSAPTATDAAIATNAMTATTAAPQAGTAEGSMDDRYSRLGRLFAEFLDRGMDIYRGGSAGSGSGGAAAAGMTAQRSIVVSGVGLGLPGTEHIFDDGNIARILHGESFIDVLPMKQRRAILDKHVTRLHKSESGARFETIEELGGVLKLAGRPGAFDLGEQYEVPDERLATLDITSKLAIAAGLDALRDAGIPLAMHYKTTTKGTKLPERWMLPEALRDDTGVIFGSAFPGYDNLADDMKRHQQAHALDARIAELEALRGRASGVLADEIARRLAELRADRERDAYVLDRKFLFRILAMGHSQLAEHIGARGPNTQINAACASGTQAVSLAQDWIRAGRCRRVLCVTADAVTSDHLMEWIGAGFLASGAAATDEIVEDAALPFDRRRHGLILGMGASGMLVESADAAAERGVAPIGEVLATATANSAFHGSRLDVDHITQIMEGLVSEAERTHGIDRRAIAAQTVFVSHETYTPARGGSAQAEIHALRRTFGDVASQVVIANTKGYTGHAMGAGVEDAVAIKMLESGIVPPISVKEIDPELGQLNLSRGGGYPVNYALRLAAGFGSQISMSLVRWVPSADGRRTPPEAMGFESRLRDRATYQRWLSTVSGYNTPKLERAHRLLRIANTGIPENAAAGATVAGANVPVPVPVPEPRAAAPAPATAPAAAAPAPAPAAPAPAPTAPVQDPVQAKVLEIVAAQTGYPPDMLDLDLDLEADLGIDTVKQAETFAAVRDAYNIVRDDQLKLRDFPTLNHVIGWVLDKRPDLATPANVPAAVPVPAPAPPAAGPDPIVAKVLAIVSEQTGYPPDMLDPELDLEADLGVDTGKQAETCTAGREAYNIKSDDNLQLKEFPTLNHVIGWVRDKRPDLAAATNVPVPVPVSSAGPDPIEAKVLAIVAEQTGYPPDMLDLDLDLGADVCVETVKPAETFAAVREAYDIERDENLQLKEFPTLNHVIG